MAFRIRPWHLAIGLILLCATVIFGLYYQRVRSASSVEKLMSRFPDGDASVLYLDLASLRSTGLLQLITRSEVPPETEYRDFVEQSGFDYAKDLDAVLASFQGDETFFFLRGRFDWGRLVEFVEQRGGDCYNGFCRTKASTPNRWISFFAITPSVMAMAVSRDAWAVDSMLAERSGESSRQPPDQPIWLSVSGPALSRADSLPAGTQAFVSALSKARQVTLTLGAARENYEAKVRVDCGSQQEADAVIQQLQAVTNVLRQMIKLEKKTPNPRDLSGVLAGGEFRSTGFQVEGRWPIHREFLQAVSGGSL